MPKIRVRVRQVDDLSYDIVIENGLLKRIPKDLKSRHLGNRYAIITDTNVSKTHAKALEKALMHARLPVRKLVFEASEHSKRLDTCEKLINQMSAAGLGADTVILAVGGGVVGDISGFIASIFNRGVPYVHVPTTLLSQADSSIGGKTGVDTNFGKNLIGTFNQPRAVYTDPLLLRSLPRDEYSNGLAEVVRHAVANDYKFFKYLEKNHHRIMKAGDDALLELITSSCRIKASLVSRDPRETGLRRTLNLGHTIGHAVERLGDYKVPHGRCVAMGLVAELRIAQEVTGLSESDTMRVERLLKYFNLPTKLPAGMSRADVIKATRIDKKAAMGRARYCLPERLGGMARFGGEYVTYVNEEIVAAALKGA